MQTRLSALAIAGVIVFLSGYLTSAQESETTAVPGPGRSRIFLRSTRDKSLRLSYIIVPPKYNPTGRHSNGLKNTGSKGEKKKEYIHRLSLLVQL